MQIRPAHRCRDASALPYGLAKLIGAVVFSTGLAMVIMTGTDLFTSTSMTLMAGVDGKFPWRQLFPHWMVGYVGNFVGALAVAAYALVWVCWLCTDTSERRDWIRL